MNRVLSANNLDHRGAQTDGVTEIFKKPRRANSEGYLEPRFDVELNDRNYYQVSTSHWPHRSNTDRRVNSDLVSYDQPTSSSYRPHATNIANKFDPRIDSDLDHRGSVTGSSDYGPCSTNIIDKLDLRYASNQDHHCTYTGRESTKYGPHSTSLANKLDPRYDSDQDHRSTLTGRGPTDYEPHSTNIANELGPRFDSSQDSGGAGSYDADYTTPNPVHRSSSLINLDPRVNFELGKCTCCKIVSFPIYLLLLNLPP
jgi:hypothetical protein